MGFFVVCVTSAVLAAATSQAATAITTPVAVSPTPVSRVAGRALIKLTPHSKTSVASVDAARLKALSGRSGVQVELVRASVLGWLLVDVSQGDLKPNEDQTLQLIERLRNDDEVSAVSDNKWMRTLAVANDPFRNQQWPLDVMDTNEAWDVTQGLSSQRIGIVDTGLIRNHEEMQGKVAGGFDFISSSDTAGDNSGRDENFEDPGDDTDSFHGTHVAGTIAAATNNGVGISGINRNAQLMIVRALGFGGGDLVDIMEGALWLAGGQVNGVPAIGANRVSVMNLSLGSASSCSQFEQDIILAIDQAGVVFVVAAGNDSGPVGSPANCAGVIAVAAHGQTLALAPYSSFGSQIDIVAPGGDQQNFGEAGGVLSSLGPNSSGYAFYEGTSMAAPHIAGVVSLMQALDPTINRQKAETLLATTGVACSSCQSKKAVNAHAAVLAARPGSPVDPPPPVDPPVDANGDDALEENDLPAQARGLACGSTRSLVALPRDQDWFDVSVAPGPMTVTLQGGAPDLDLYLLQNDGIIAQSESSSGNEAINVNVGGSGVLQVMINPFDDTNSGVAHTGPYNLTITCTPGEAIAVEPEPGEPLGDDVNEPNNVVDAAVEIFCAEEVVDLTLNDDDWFFIEVRDGDTLKIAKTGAGDAEIAIVDGAGAVLNAGATGAEAPALLAGRYLVLIPSGVVAASYSLSVQCTESAQAPSGPPLAVGGCASSSPTMPLMGVFGLLGLLRPRRFRR